MSDGVKPFAFHSSDIAANWHLIEPFLFDHYEWTAAGVRQALESARAQCWGLLEDNQIKGILITKTKGKVGILWIASGRGLEPGLELLALVEQWMREKGCEFAQIEGRRGWGRVLKDYEEMATVFLKRLQ